MPAQSGLGFPYDAFELAAFDAAEALYSEEAPTVEVSVLPDMALKSESTKAWDFNVTLDESYTVTMYVKFDSGCGAAPAASAQRRRRLSQAASALDTGGEYLDFSTPGVEVEDMGFVVATQKGMKAPADIDDCRWHYLAAVYDADGL